MKEYAHGLGRSKSAAEHQANTPDNGRRAIVAPPGANGLDARRLLERLESALLGLRPDEAVGLTAVYLTSGADRAPPQRRV